MEGSTGDNARHHHQRHHDAQDGRGNELCRKIKNDVRTSHIPVILLTAKDTDADKTVGYNAGADSYLTKPFTVGLLRARVDNLLRQRQQLNDTIAHSEPDFSLKRKQLQASLQDIDRQFFQQLDHLIEERISGSSSNSSTISSRSASREMST